MITIYKTFAFTSLILASKGFCIISNILRRRDLSIVALVMGSVYLIYSAYFIDPQLVAVVLLIVLLILFYITMKNTLENIKLLQARQLTLAESDLQSLIAPIQAKVSLLSCFLKLSFFYFIEQFVVQLISFSVYISESENSSFTTSIIFIEETLELIGICGILFILRPRNVQYLEMSLVELNQARRALTPLYHAKLPENLNTAIVPNKPLLLIAPKGYDHASPYRNLLIGNPILVNSQMK